MEYTKEDIRNLQSYRTILDSDNISIKEKIKKKLLSNKDIIHVLHNTELEKVDAEPDDYFGVNILSYYLIHPVQVDVQNFICYTTHFKEIPRYNKVMKYQEITFVVLCEQKNLIDKDTGLARHDLLGALIMNEFNYSNDFGIQIHCVSDEESVVDNDYSCRTLVFEQTIDGNITKTIDGISTIINKLGNN